MHKHGRHNKLSFYTTCFTNANEKFEHVPSSSSLQQQLTNANEKFEHVPSSSSLQQQLKV